MKGFVFALALVVSTALAGPARAQGARVNGTITDAMQAVLPAVTVTAEHVDAAEHTTTSVKTDRDGHYQFPELRPGSYTLSASLPGFETYRASMNLDAGDYRERNIVLEVGSLQETITVNPGDTPEPRRADTPRTVPPPPSPPPAGAVRIGGNIKAPTKTLDVHPAYPPAEAAQGTEGTVQLLATIGPDGSVRDIRVDSATNANFSSAASAAVSQWQFTPTLLDGNPVDVHMRVAVYFKK